MIVSDDGLTGAER